MGVSIQHDTLYVLTLATVSGGGIKLNIKKSEKISVRGAGMFKLFFILF
jgi:hypothetical protein